MQLLSVNWDHQIFAMSSRAQGAVVNAMSVDFLMTVSPTGTDGCLIQLGSYHYISGVDASSSASLAAYINSLTYAIEDSSAWFSKSAAWKVRNGCYWYGLAFTSSPVRLMKYFHPEHSCFNAFSRVDIRIDVKIPGGVNAYVIDLRGERCAVLYSFQAPTSQSPRKVMKQHQKSGKRHMSQLC